MSTRAPMPWDPMSLLMSRFGFGIESQTRAELVKYGYDGWWARQLALGKAAGTPGTAYTGHAQVAAQGPLLTRNPVDIRSWMKANGNEYGWDLMDQLTLVTLGLQAWSPATLFESVVDFFANHLNVANHSDAVWTTRHTIDRDVVRKYALGSYTDMLLASARNPAMLQYLNLATSTKTAVNENYGRELLELHTVGLGAHYTESDVQNSAKILTGRTLDAGFNYVYNPAKHYLGPVRILGFSHANATAADGEAAGDAYLRYLASHPNTANRLAQKLCVRFVSDSPTPTLVAAVADAYLKNGTQIVPMLDTIVRSTEFWSSRGAKVRRPLENLMATVRALGVGPGDASQSLPILHWMAVTIGQCPLDWTAPNGYPDGATAWRSSGTLVNLWAYHRGLAGSWWDAFGKIDLASFYGSPKPTTSGQAIIALSGRLTGSRLPATHLAALQTFLKEPASTPLDKSNLRWYLGDLVSLILDSPQHSLR
ncbi:MAG: DUF1800 domain-containing protein [Jatrophihabitans sp.]